MKISKDDFDLVKCKLGDDGDNLTWTDGEVLHCGKPLPEEEVKAIQEDAEKIRREKEAFLRLRKLAIEYEESEKKWGKTPFPQAVQKLVDRGCDGMGIPQLIQVVNEICDTMSLLEPVEGVLVPTISFTKLPDSISATELLQVLLKMGDTLCPILDNLKGYDTENATQLDLSIYRTFRGLQSLLTSLAMETYLRRLES